MAISNDNPYAPPVMDQPSRPSSQPGQLPHYGPKALRITVADFRSQSRGLAATAFFFGVMASLFGILLSIRDNAESFLVPSIGFAIAGVFFVFGVGIVKKSIAALQAFRICLWLLILLTLIAVPPGWPFTVVFGLVAAQCHRVLRFARIILAVRVPLTAKPHETPLISP
jgi:hypothetical protein